MGRQVQRNFSIDSNILSAFEAVVPRGERSDFVQKSMAARAGVKVKVEEGIPREKILEDTVVKLTTEKEELIKKIEQKDKEFKLLLDKYNRFVARGRGR